MGYRETREEATAIVQMSVGSWTRVVAVEVGDMLESVSVFFK